MILHEIIDRHDDIVLHFSGGKDSLAVIALCRPWWDKIKVLYCNTGDEFPETREVIDAIKKLPITLIEVSPDEPQPDHVAKYGYPSDVLPLRNTQYYSWLTGREMTGVDTQHPMNCCGKLLFEPLQQATLAIGATLVIRGQRMAEDKHSPVRSGDVIDGVEYLFPIENWDDNDVDQFLTDSGVSIPTHYQHVRKSLDCMTCTAFLDESKDKIAYLKQFHPETYQEVTQRLKAIKASIDIEHAHLIEAVNI
jgi:phosphoadenosine phosphosulfate reductase